MLVHKSSVVFACGRAESDSTLTLSARRTRPVARQSLARHCHAQPLHRRHHLDNFDFTQPRLCPARRVHAVSAMTAAHAHWTAAEQCKCLRTRSSIEHRCSEPFARMRMTTLRPSASSSTTPWALVEVSTQRRPRHCFRVALATCVCDRNVSCVAGY